MTRRKSSSGPGLTRERQRSKVQALSRRIQDDLFALAALAQEGKQAPKELHTAAVLAAHWLNLNAGRQPELFSPIAEASLSWPANYDPHREEREKLELFLKSLCLGKKTNINVSGEGKAFSWNTPANVVAVDLLRLAEALRREPIPPEGLAELARCGVGCRPNGNHVNDAAYQRQLKALEHWGQVGPGTLLPQLCKGTAVRWARETPGFFRLVFGEEFDKHPRLQELKTSVYGKGIDASGKRLRTGDVRKLMIQRVKQAWSSIAPLD